MNALDKIFDTLHQNVKEGKLYEALMQYKSLYSRYVRRSPTHGLSIITDGCTLLSQEKDLNAFYGLVDFYVKILTAKKEAVTEEEVNPLLAIKNTPIDKEKEKALEEIFELCQRNKLSAISNTFAMEMCLVNVKLNNIQKAVNYSIGNVKLFESVMKEIEQSETVKHEHVYLLTTLKTLLVEPKLARNLYSFVESNYKGILGTRESQASVLLTVLVMKVVEQIDPLDKICEAFGKAEGAFKDVFETCKEDVGMLKAKYFTPQKERTQFNPFIQPH
ncbi:hypothetical protein EIN_371120 [Entamoeba invadens IP1]|uniref:Uncharacterized protein n=2 Tax=Entamoeba invadens TaxID=33085 RepID=A0A0A1UBX7_ENTIV|nr:hypothetical protein EIN_371120 [Entamoeba invadens IP1]ELP92710.1 hypothetical protein EIN_371120 [Entamoeba invadens IP1]BAN40515.1 hypothetical protein [Entamoeba invadens]|eukprot:XP_004259481.1 hypothetical protein EIN_371120 [Entamoeba invadens IP1]